MRKRDPTTFRVETYNGETLNVQDCKSRIYLHTLGYVDFVFSTNAIKVNGAEFWLSLFVCLEVERKREDGLSLFGRIDEILILERNEVYFLITLYKTHLFDTDFIAYYIDFEMDEVSQLFINCLNLGHHKPFSIWSEPTSNRSYISLRHILL